MKSRNAMPRMKFASVLGWFSFAIVVVCWLSTIAIAFLYSQSLVSIRLTALDANSEPKDHPIPFVQKEEQKPDYQAIIKLKNGSFIHLGTKPNQSAIDTLTWDVNKPVGLVRIASIRIEEKDVLISDPIAEVQVTSPTIVSNGYRLEFKIQRSFSSGMETFFTLPIGIAISWAFSVAILAVLFTIIVVFLGPLIP